jgi:hypothetical protein
MVTKSTEVLNMSDEPPSFREDSEESTTVTPPAHEVDLRTRDLGVLEDQAPQEQLLGRAAGSTATSALRRPRGWLAYLLVLVLVFLALLLRFAVFTPPTQHAKHPVSNSLSALTATPAPTATPSPGVTPNATPGLPAGGGHPVPTAGPVGTFTVTAAEASSAPTSQSGYCNPPLNEYFEGDVYVPGTTPGGTITYRWRFSDGSVTPVQSVVVGPTDMSAFYGAANNQNITGQWAVNPSTADGSTKWAEFEVLTPSHLLSPPAYFQMTCLYRVQSATPSVSGGTSPAHDYDCAAGGDQTFTFTGTITIDPDWQSHTITYYWLRSDGTQGAVQSMTISPGQGSATVQPDAVVVTQAEALANYPNLQAKWEEIIVTSSPGVPTTNLGAEYFASCPS